MKLAKRRQMQRYKGEWENAGNREKKWEKVGCRIESSVENNRESG